MTDVHQAGIFSPGIPQVEAVLDVGQVIAAIDRAVLRYAHDDSPPRWSIPTTGGELLLMPAVADTLFGVKLISVAPDNPAHGLPRIQGIYVLFEQATHAVSAIFDASRLTSVRTAAFSGWVTNRLAQPTASRLLVYGTGPQALAHIEAMRAVRPITEVRVIGRSSGTAERVVAQVRESGIDASVGSDADQGWADIICCCTSSATPIIDDALLTPGVHINAVGSHHPQRRELSGATMARARLVVETRPSALTEAGDIVMALAEGAIAESDLEFDISELAVTDLAHREDKDITVFKSVGVGFEDLLVAEYVVAALADR